MKPLQSIGPFAKFAKPAQRALANAGSEKLEDLSRFTEKELRALHGMGSGTVKLLMLQMEVSGIKFKE